MRPAGTVASDPDVAAVQGRDPGRTWHVLATGWFTGRRKLLSSHFSRDGEVGAANAAAELVRQGFADVQVWDARSGQRWRL